MLVYCKFIEVRTDRLAVLQKLPKAYTLQVATIAAGILPIFWVPPCTFPINNSDNLPLFDKYVARCQVSMSKCGAVISSEELFKVGSEWGRLLVHIFPNVVHPNEIMKRVNGVKLAKWRVRSVALGRKGLTCRQNQLVPDWEVVKHVVEGESLVVMTFAAKCI